MRPVTFEIYRTLTLYGKRWFWRLRGANHRIIAVGGEGFANRTDVLSIIHTMMDGMKSAELVEL
jgi:uncharacterized protein YegP (UPF0339 family)